MHETFDKSKYIRMSPRLRRGFQPLFQALRIPETAWKIRLLYVAAWTLSKVLSTISAIPWMAKNFDHTNQEDFPLPRYPIFDDESSQSVTFHKGSAGDN
jgi:hypothetical protein